MRIGAIVHARMTSSRLPGKVLMPLAERPALLWLLERLEHAEKLDEVVLATSDDPTDDAIAAFAEEHDVRCHRGELADVAGRVLGAARTHDFEAFARINGDSPLLDQRLVDRGAALMRDACPDLVTNVRPRTFPPGQSVEVVRTEALALVHDRSTAEEREHVTGPLYDGAFRIVRFETDPPRTAPSLTLDTLADHTRLEAILTGMGRPHWDYGWEDLL